MANKFYTKQEAFDIVLNGLRAQGAPSIEPYEIGSSVTCRYRGPNGLKCAAGHLLKDEYYDEEVMEGKISACIDPNLFGMRDTNGSYKLIRAMQNAHDDSADISCNFKNKNWLTEFEAKMQNVAKKYKLKYTEAS